MMMSFRFIHYIHVRLAVQLASPLRLNGNNANKRMDRGQWQSATEYEWTE